MNTQSTTVTISHHAEDRLKERMGIPKKAALATAQKAFDEGVTHSNARGKLHRWITKMYHEHKLANNTRVYAHHIFLFKGSHLITVIKMPQWMANVAEKSKRPKQP